VLEESELVDVLVESELGDGTVTMSDCGAAKHVVAYEVVEIGIIPRERLALMAIPTL